DFCYGSGKGDHVVTYLGLDLLNAREGKVRSLANGFSRRLGHNTGLRQGFCGCQFDLEPGAETVLLAPDLTHFTACIACDHRKTPFSVQEAGILNAASVIWPVREDENSELW